jgi:hypothetical protein
MWELTSMAEHRVSVLSESLRRFEDPEHSRDPRIRRLVIELRQIEAAPAPRAHFRAELRSQLVAVAPRLVAEGVTAELPAASREAARPAPAADRPAHAQRVSTRRPVFGRLSGVSIARPIAVAAAVVAVFALLLGGAVMVSKKALPGDTLYSLKRANENVKLSLANGGTAKGKQYLDLAAARAAEVADLLKRSSALAAGSGNHAAAGISAHTADLVTDTLNSGDDDVRNAAKLLGTEAVEKKSAAPLSALTSWAPGQLSLLQTITERLPAGSLHDRATASTQLVGAALTRGAALENLLGCSCLASAPTDELGPVPCTVCNTVAPTLPNVPAPTILPSGAPATSGPQKSTDTNPSTAGTGTTGATTGSNGTETSSGSGTVVGPSTDGSSPAGGHVTLPPVTLPPITLPSISLPTPTTTKPKPSPTCLLNLLGVCVHF